MEENGVGRKRTRTFSGEEKEEREQVGWERTVGEKGSERLQERNRRE